MHQVTPNLELFINRLIRRSELSRDERAVILRLPTETVTVSANRDIVQIGDQADHLTFIVSGLAGSFVQDRRGFRQFTGLHIEGDAPDLQALVLPYSSSGLQAISDTTILKVNRSAMKEVVFSYPAIFHAVWKDTLVDLAVLAKWAAKLGQRKARERIAHLFCEMACRYGHAPTSDVITFRLPMTQDQLASATGMSKVHANRSVAELKSEGVSFGYEHVQIDSWKRITEIAQFDPAYLVLPADLTADGRHENRNLPAF